MALSPDARRSPRACDSCRRRKVRCSGREPCPQCSHLGLPCRFSVRPVRKQGARGCVMAELRGGHVRSERGGTRRLPAALPVLLPRSPHPEPQRQGLEAPQSSQCAPIPQTRRDPRADAFPEAFFLLLLPSYEKYTYPVNPVITVPEVIAYAQDMHADDEHAALVYALAAATINLAQPSREPDGATSGQIRELMMLSQGARGRQAPDSFRRDARPTVAKIMTCIFLEICWMSFSKYDHAFLALREAVTMIQMLWARPRQAADDGRDGAAAADVARRQRMYWEAYIHERFLSITMSYPAALPPLPSGMPVADPTIPQHVHVGFGRIIRLFAILDDEFLSYWILSQSSRDDGRDDGRDGRDDGHRGHRHRRDRPLVTAEWIERKHQQLDDDEREAAAGRGDNAAMTELQHADLIITRAWLRTLLWQLAMSQCLLSSAPPSSAHEAMSLFFPARRLSARLRAIVGRLESAATSISRHGSGIRQKLFEIANTMADVVVLLPPTAREWESLIGAAGIADFFELVHVFFSAGTVDALHRRIIEDKIDTLRRMFPGIDVYDTAAPRLSE